MARRGRPRHPDILTPREWEVLALLRDGLSNEEIAQRLDITVRTARYHVSEILSKLNVSSREKAAAWQPEERRSWWAGLFAPVVLAKRIKLAWIGMAGMAAVVVAGVAVLAWGLAKAGPIGGGDGSSVHAVGTATPNAVPILSEEKARDIALREADLKGMPESDSLVLSLRGADAPEPASVDERPVWSASVTGRFFPSSAQPQPVITEYRRIEIIIDSATESVLSVDLLDPVYITPLPLSLAPGGHANAEPTATPMPVPPGARLLTEAEVRARFSDNPEIDQETLWVDLRTAADISPSIGPFAPDYPIWIVRAEGAFYPTFGGPVGSTRHQFHRMMTFIDAVTGMTIGYSLSGAAD